MTMIYVPLIKEHQLCDNNSSNNSSSSGGIIGICHSHKYIHVISSANVYFSFSLRLPAPFCKDIEHKKRIKLLCPFYQTSSQQQQYERFY